MLQDPKLRRIGALVLENLLLTVGYLLLTVAVQRLDVEHGLLLAFWPVAGYCVAVLYLRGLDRWPAIFIGSSIVGWSWIFGAGGGIQPGDWLGSFFGPVVRVASAVLAVQLIRRRAGPRPLHHVDGVVVFVVVAGLLYPLANTASTAINLWIRGNPLYADALFRWFVANSAGTLLVAPPLIVLSERGNGAPRRSAIETFTSGVAILTIAVLVFRVPRNLLGGYPPVFYVTAALSWAAVRFQVRGALLALVGVSSVAAVSLALADLPTPALVVALTRLQLFLEVLSVTMLILAAAVEERREAGAQLDRANRELEQRVEERTEALQQTIRVRDDFLSVASHEMKTPLTTLKVQLQQAQRLASSSPDGTLGVEQLQPRLETGLRQLNRIHALIDDLLDVSQLTSGSIAMEPAPGDLRELLIAVAGRHAEQALRAGSEIVLDAPQPVPGNWDSRRLEQVIGALLSNALKFGAGRPVELRLEPTERGARIVVSDRGIGISPDDLPRIFERFERAVESRHYGGFGLGLWMARRIVEAMGGTITAASVPGHGATFTVEIPYSPANHS